MEIISVNAFLDMAKRAVAERFNEGAATYPYATKISEDNVILVWYSKTLQNHKAFLITSNVEDWSYYEATYNGDEGVLYLDTYMKLDNKVIREERG